MDNSQLGSEEEKEQMIEFLMKLSEFEEIQNEVELGCRKQDDITNTKFCIENL